MTEPVKCIECQADPTKCYEHEKELKPCQLDDCGGDAVLEMQRDNISYCIWCSKCGAGTGTGSKEEVSDWWNEVDVVRYD